MRLCHDRVYRRGGYAPALVLRKEGMKHIHCRTDPPMLLDLDNDPHELRSVADGSGYAEIAKRLKAEIDRRWEYDDLERMIMASQKRRLFVQQALVKGNWTRWDHQPAVDATRAYVRGAVAPSTTATKAPRRLPFVAEVAPHHTRQGKPALDLKPRR